jgi:imidazolonepropionase-like amidohydrolase
VGQAMTRYIRCGRFWDGVGNEVLKDRMVVIEGATVAQVLPAAGVELPPGAELLDYSRYFVMPGMIDVHTHLSYGNAKTEEDIDLYAPVEFRALRGAFFARQVLAAGFTSICTPGGAGQVSTAIRDAVDADLFEGPGITAAGPYITSRQGLTDWYPTWIGVPSTSIGRLVKSRDEAIEEVRRQVKDGVDVVKIALDGILRRPDGEYVAAFTADETMAMVDEIHRLGKKAVAHARGREAVLYAGRAGVDLIFHASYMDDEALEWVLKNKCAISPSLTLLRNTMDFVQPGDPYYRKGRRQSYQIEFDAACENLNKARREGVPMPTGTDTGFAVTPYGEWHARELEIYVQHLGFSPLEALKAATSVSANVLRPSENVGRLEAGMRADLVAVDGDPTRDIGVLLKEDGIAAVIRNGRNVDLGRKQEYEPRRVSDFAMTMFSDIYTRARVASLQSGHQD